MYETYAKIRDEKGFTDYKVAKSIGVTTATISQWKKGTCDPSFKNLVAIADCLGISIELLAQALRERKNR